MVNLRKDFVGSHLRSQIETLKDILITMEIEGSISGDYLDENLKRLEKSLRQLRRLSKNENIAGVGFVEPAGMRNHRVG